jgi:hypothetical protein
MDLKTIIYVSSNMEDPVFEEKTRKDLLEKSNGLPIVSVTQKPVNLGTNICVGNVGASGFNFCRQVLKACEAAGTPYVVSAESDCLYSPDYFEFTPERLDIPYRNTNIYVQKYRQDFVCKKKMSTFSQVIGREFYIKRLRMLLDGQPEWDVQFKNFPKEIHKVLFEEFATWETKYPCISFKTGKGMRKHSNSDEVPVYDLPYWGNIKLLKEKYEVD